MARQVAVAAGLGAAGGAVTAVVAFLAVSAGSSVYFRASMWRETRRASKESAA